MLVLFVYGVNLLILSIAHSRHEILEPGLPETDSAGTSTAQEPPFVTIQLPVFNEVLVVSRLIGACTRLRYPRERLEIQILDDSTDETTTVIARIVASLKDDGWTIVHLHRTHRDGFKAGALRDGLAVARGELIALFDADFVPNDDFLEQLVPDFQDPTVGMVQARWGHINPDHSLLTRIQAFGLDTHFTLEQRIRNLTGCFINFNGTAGMWRRTCIEDAGGWTSDTLTEDFDLSYRAQMKGWNCVYRPDVEVPAELPVAIHAFRVQQYRWTKGALQTAIKLLRPLWRSDVRLRAKWEGTVHLTANLVFPFVVLAAIFHAPLVFLQRTSVGPGEWFFALLSVGLLGFTGFFLAQVFSQKYLYADWWNRLRIFPIFMAGSIGMSLSNVRAIVAVLFRRSTPFVRTPKFGLESSEAGSAWWRSRYSETRIPGVAYAELALGLYSLAGMVYTVSIGAWAAVPFQAMFTVGFLLVAIYSFGQNRLATDHTPSLPDDGRVM